MGRIEKTVFISYRRVNSPWALAISQFLTHRGYDVFFDFLSLPAGSFEQAITENIKARAHFLTLLAPSALDRCEDPNDWLRREIEIAIDYKRNIIPIMLEGFDFYSPETVRFLTGKLERLSEYSGITLPAEYFDAGMDRLCLRYLNIALDEVKHPVIKVPSKKVQQLNVEQKKAIANQPLVDLSTLSAQEWFERGYKAVDTEEKIRLYTKAIELDPGFVNAYNNRGVCFIKLMQLEQAIQEFDHAIKLNPEDFEAYYNRGNVYSKLEEYQTAIDNYDQAIKIKPKEADAYNNRGLCYVNLNLYERAIEDFNQTLLLRPEDGEVFFNRGISYSELHMYEEAIEDYCYALALISDDAEIFYNRAVGYSRLYQNIRALDDCDQAIMLDPQMTNAYYLRGVIKSRLNQESQAIDDFSQALTLDPDNQDFLYNRGLCYSKIKDYTKAITDFNHATFPNRPNADIFFSKGQCLIRLGLYKKAIIEFDKVLTVNPDNPDCYYNKGCSYALQGQTHVDEAVKCLRFAFIKHPKHYHRLAEKDVDLNGIREEPAFKELMTEFSAGD